MPAPSASPARSRRYRTRRAIIDLLKRDGPRDAASIAEQLGVSPMAVRQHLYALQVESLVDYQEESRPLGRPAKLWKLAGAAQQFFPDAHAELTIGLLAAMGEAFGQAGIEKLLTARTRQQIAAYRRKIPRRYPLQRRVRMLAQLRTQEGYMAEVARDGSAWLLVENHCPICAAATACTGLCASELETFQAVLGPGVHVERTDHILGGARRCAYRVQAARPTTRS